MGTGEVDSMDTPSTNANCNCSSSYPEWYLVRMKMDAGYYIKYVHLKTTSLCVGDRVNPGTVLGEYDQIPLNHSTYAHVHVRVESPKYSKVDPAPYWPSEAPTDFRFGNPTAFP